MSGVLCTGSGARIEALQTTLDGPVAAGLITNPWRVTALPGARQWAHADAVILSPTYFTQRFGQAAVLAANTTLQTLVSITGSGFLEFAGVHGDAASGTVRLVITVDGTDILDATGASAATYRMLCGCGTWTGWSSSTPSMVFEPARVPFRSSLVLKAQQSAILSAALLYRYVLAEPYTA